MSPEELAQKARDAGLTDENDTIGADDESLDAFIDLLLEGEDE